MGGQTGDWRMGEQRVESGWMEVLTEFISGDQCLPNNTCLPSWSKN